MAEPVVTLAEVKQHCRIDFDDEDNLILSYIKAAQEWAEGFLNVDVSTAENIKETWKQAIMLVVGDWILNREVSTAKKPIPNSAEYLLWQDRNLPV